ncbi:MAG: hypothetical protein HQ472_05465 [Ignavibacteria bacterium]|nr:hypothetical protein [Ignavibacteria bacterium]
MKPLLVLLIFLAGSTVGISQDLPQRLTVLTPCEHGAYRLYSLCAVDSQNIVAVGSLGRVGILNIFTGSWNWECLPVNFTLRHVQKINNELWTVGEGGTIWRKNIGTGDWRYVAPPDGSNLTGIVGVDDGIVVTTDSGKFFHWTSLTDTWSLTAQQDGFRSGTPSGKGNTVVVPSFDGRVARSVDGGITWTFQKVSEFKLRAALVLTDSVLFVAGSGGRVFRSSDTGATFEEYALLPISTADLNDENETTDTFWSLTKGTGNQVFACGRMWIEMQSKQNYQAVYRGKNEGTSWSNSKLSEWFELLDHEVYASPAIGAVMLDSAHGVCVTSSDLHNSIGVHVTVNGGDLWTPKAVWYAGALLVESDITPQLSGRNVINSDVGVSSDSGLFVLESYSDFGILMGSTGYSKLIKLSGWQNNVMKRDTIAILPGSFTRLSVDGAKMAVFGGGRSYAISSDSGRSWTTFDSVDGFQEAGQLTTVMFGDGNSIFTKAQVISTPMHSWGYTIPLLSSDFGKTWRIPEYNYKVDYVYGAFKSNKLSNGSIAMNVLMLPSPTEAYQEMVTIDQQGLMKFLPPLPPDFREKSRKQPVLIVHDETIVAIASQQWNVNGKEVNALKRITFKPESGTWQIDSTFWFLYNKIQAPKIASWKYSNRSGNSISMINNFSEVYASSDGGINWHFIPKILTSYDANIDAALVIGNRCIVSGGSRLLYSFGINDVTSHAVEPSDIRKHQFPIELCSELGGSFRIFSVLGQLLREGSFLEYSELEGQIQSMGSNQLLVIEVLQKCGRTVLKTYH